MGNAFRCTPDGSLDRLYLRTCTVYRLLKAGKIGQAQALEISNRPLRRGWKPKDHLKRTIELWKSGPLKGMKP